MIELQSTLEAPKVELKPNHLYMVDFSKMNSVNDLIIILASLGIAFPSDHPNIEKIRPFLKTDSPIPMEQKEPTLKPFKEG